MSLFDVLTMLIGFAAGAAFMSWLAILFDNWSEEWAEMQARDVLDADESQD